MEPRLTELHDQCRDDTVDRVMSEVLLEVVESDIVTQREFMKLLTRLGELAKGFVHAGRFEEILLIYNTLYTHSLSGRFRSEAANTLEYFFHSNEFVTDLVAALRTWGTKNREGARRLTRAFRKSIISPLLAKTLNEKEEEPRKFLLSLLTQLGPDIVPAVRKALSSRESEQVRILLYLIRKCGSEGDIPAVRRLLGDREQRTGIAVLRTLLHFRTKDAIPHLNVYLEAKDFALRLEAIHLAGTYKLKETVPALVALLEKKDLLGNAYAEKTAAIRMLGRIGDPTCLPALSALLESKTLIKRALLEDLKIEICRSMSNYPLSDAEPLLKQGILSESEVLRAASSTVLSALYLKSGETPVDA